MRTKLQRGLCLILCVVMAFSCLTVSVGAVTPAIAALAPLVKDAVAAWLIGETVDSALQSFKDWVDGKTTDPTGYIAPIGALRTAQKTEVTEDRLRELAYEWNVTCSEAVGFTVDVVDYTMDTGEVYRIIAVRRGYVVTTAATQWCLADGVQRILYCDATTETSGRWCSPDYTTGRQMLDYDTFWNLKEEVGGIICEVDGGVFWEIVNRAGEVYCNPSGRRFSFNYANSNLAINANRPTTGGTIIEGDTVTNIENNDNSVVNNDYSQDIDIENMQQALPGGIMNNIDNLIYDDNTKTYYVDSHDVTNNITQNFLYEYHINYTSITYIGQTEEYNKRYELYYQLPDGRDSADLTREELEQLNVDIDVIPYVRYADNLDIRSLYHFDGDTRDASYWNYCTSFEWLTGASLTYMESGAFDGALYLDELQHDFQLTLPQATDAVGDWTLQWRYYQSHTEAPVKDSAVYVGDSPVMELDGKYLYTPAGDQISPVPVGTWNEICIIRSGGKLHYYLNGVYYTSCADVSNRFDSVRFQFGDQQQTYKYFDELRFMRGNTYTPGENYSPTSVPHDSNLALILPSGTDVVVDEVTVMTPGENNLLAAYGRDDWLKFSFTDLEGGQGDYTPYYPYHEYSSAYFLASSSWGDNLAAGYPIIWDRSYLYWKRLSGQGYRVAFSGTALSMTGTEDDCYYQPAYSFSLPLYVQVINSDGRFFDSDLVGDWQQDQVYTYSVVLADHSYSSVTFEIVSCADNGYHATPGHKHNCDTDRLNVEILNVVQNSEIQFAFEDYGLVDPGEWDDELEEYEYDLVYPLTCLVWNSVDGVAEVTYTELVAGDHSEFEIKYESAVYDSGDLEYSPTLAVRTDLDIIDYQIGGVRPSVPQKGQVWALVESGYITSLQIYTGSVWENCDGRIWTGSRWIPASSYNVITLQDMYDIVDSTQDYEYIYTESGFWDWLQRAWKDLLDRLDKIIGGLEGKQDAAGECQHVYDSEIKRDPTCIDPGHKVYTCSNCGHTFTELLDPLGHIWPFDPHVFAIHRQPQSMSGPLRSYVEFSLFATGEGLQYQWQYRMPEGQYWNKSTAGGATSDTLRVYVSSVEDGMSYRCKITDASGSVIYSDIVTLTVGDAMDPAVNEPIVCSRCGISGKYDGKDIVSSGWDALDDDIFDAAGNLIAEGITWLLDKATELVNALTGITDVFNRFVDRIGDLIGLYPAFLAAVFVLLPEDLTTVIWFGVIAFVMLAVWKKYNKS